MQSDEEKTVACAEKIFNSCLKIKQRENVLVVFDKYGEYLANALSAASIGKKYDLCLRYVPYEEQKYLTEIDRLFSIRKCISCSDCLIYIGTNARECNRFRINMVNTAKANHSKIIHMPGVPQEVFLFGTLGLDFQKLHASCRKIARKLNNKRHIEIITKTVKGTNYHLKLQITERPVHISGSIAHPGKIMNFPTGEVFIAPLEDSASGSIVINGSTQDCIFRSDDEVILNFSHGVLNLDESSFPNEANSRRLLTDFLIPFREQGNDNITLGEFGIGLNPLVKELRGRTIIDEKALGTAHIALGANKPFDGTLNANVHLDLIFTPNKVIIDKHLLKHTWKKLRNHD